MATDLYLILYTDFLQDPKNGSSQELVFLYVAIIYLLSLKCLIIRCGFAKGIYDLNEMLVLSA